MNIRAHYPGFKIWAGAQADVDRVTSIRRDCLMRYGGPYLFGEAPCAADAMYAPVCTRFATYDVKLDAAASGYCRRILACPACANGSPPRTPNRTSSTSSTSSFERAPGATRRWARGLLTSD